MKDNDIIPLRPRSTMKKFRILFDIRYYNGSIDIEATNEAEARLKFDQIPAEQLVEQTNDVAVDVEEIEKVA